MPKKWLERLVKSWFMSSKFWDSPSSNHFLKVLKKKFFFRFFPLVPQGRFFQVRVPPIDFFRFFFRFFFHYWLNSEFWIFQFQVELYQKEKNLKKNLKKSMWNSIGGTLTWKNLPWGTKGKNLKKKSLDKKIL